MIILTTAVFLVSMFAGCGGGGEMPIEDSPEDHPEALVSDQKDEPREPQLVRLEGSDVGYPSPFAHYPRMRGTVMKMVFDSLLEPDGENCKPWLAKEWSISADGLTHTIDLQEGVKWHDGKPMTAQDVVFSFNYYLEYPPVFIGEVITQPGYIRSVEAVSDTQVVIETAEPNATFYCEAGMLRIIPQHIWQDVVNPYEFLAPEAALGCGPYILTNYSKEHGTYRYEAFADYWGPRQRVDVIEYVPVSDPLLALEKGDISIARISPDLLSRFAGNSDFTIEESPALAGTMLSFNMNRNPLFQKREFRQAVAYAIDQDEIVEKVMRGAALPGSPGILPIHHQFYNPNLPAYNHNPDKAQELLRNIGVDQGISLELLVSEGSEVRIGELLREQLGRVGIDLKITAVDSKSRDARANEGNYEMAILAMGAWGLDADYLRIRYISERDKGAGGSATALLGCDQGYKNNEVDRLVLEQLHETDYEKRKEILFSLQELLARDVPEIPLFNNYYLYAFRPGEYDGWTFMFDHAVMEHAKLSYLER